ncbi:MAG: SIS domain-containing protein [Gammaproteobacteria bacterium]|nr:SIS domain-containing protein [Gammaproteobacteria bacterium]
MALWNDIFEQPGTLERVVSQNWETAEQVAETWRRAKIDQVVVAARGTSDNAARYAQYVWGARNRLSVCLAAPSLYSLYNSPPALGNAIVVGISQSGQSPDITAVLIEARRQHRPTLAITNNASSPLAEHADHVILLRAGSEEAVAATKTYTAELAAVLLLSAALNDEAGMEHELVALPSHVEYLLDQSDDIAEMARARSSLEHCAVLGRGFNYATAFEWALKLQELAYVLAQPFSVADFLHGPLALVEPGLSILAVAPSGPPHDDYHALLEALVRGQRADLVVISDVEATLELAASFIRLPVNVPEWITPIPAIVGGQLFAYHLTVAKGLDPERPRGLSKVTRTW